MATDGGRTSMLQDGVVAAGTRKAEEKLRADLAMREGLTETGKQIRRLTSDLVLMRGAVNDAPAFIEAFNKGHDSLRDSLIRDALALLSELNRFALDIGKPVVAKKTEASIS